MTQMIVGENLIDPQTGEVIEDISGTEDLVFGERSLSLEALLTGSQGIARHIEELKKLNLPPQKQAMMLSLFTGMEPHALKYHLGQEIGITGAIVYFSGAYMSKQTGQIEQGFYTILLLTDQFQEQAFVGSTKKIKRPIVLKCSGKKVAEWALMMIDACGWYKWEETIKVVFSQGENNAYYITPVE
jgi:hypothetical protein